MIRFYLVMTSGALSFLACSCAQKQFPAYRDSIIEVTHKYPDANRRVPITDKFANGTGGQGSGGVGGLRGLKRGITDPNNRIAELIGSKAVKPLSNSIMSMAPSSSNIVR